jgi:hypothetical protein
MMKRSKIIMSIFTVFATLIASLVLSSALGYANICLRETEILPFSECNPTMEDYVCETTSCQLCTNEVDTGIYCPASLNACQDACTYLYEDPGGEEQEDPLPIVLLNSPENNEQVEIGEVKFNFTASPYGEVDYCWLMIDDVQAKRSGIIRNENIIKYSLEQGIYEWRIECVERSAYGGRTATSELRTLYVGEESPNAPKKVILTSPATGTQLTGAQEVSFTFDISEAILGSLTQCDLYLNDASVSSITTLAASNEIKYTAEVNSYNWKVKCDNYDSEVRSLSIVAPSSGGGGNSGGGGGGGGGRGGGGGGGGGSSMAIAYAPSKTQMGSGYTKTLKTNDTLRFYVSNEGTDEQHKITYNGATGNISVELTIESDPITEVFTVGEEKKFDLTSDSYYDLSIKLNSIDATGKGNLTFKVIKEQIPQEEEATEEQETSEPETVDTDLTGASVGFMDRIKSNRTVIIVIAVIVVIVTFYFLFSGKKEKKE